MSEGARRRRRSAALIAIALVTFVAGGLVFERSTWFAGARDRLRGNSGPAGTPNDGVVGDAVAAAIDRFGAAAALSGRAESLPSTVVMRPDDLDGPLPVVSIAADNDFLHDPDTGILANLMETGPDWERLATVSLWEDGELVLGSRAGLRIHGDSTRFRGQPSFRLYFRPSYGAARATGGRLLGPEAEPASVIVVHVVRYEGHYPNVFVFEIARRLGLPTTEFRPAEVFLNGEPRGVYVLTERVMPDGWGLTHFGNTEFFMHVYKGETRPASLAAHAELTDWVTANDPLTMEQASERIDVDNLTRHLFTVMFSFTTDWAQGAALLDRDDPAARWFWLHWDMDQSFHVRGAAVQEAWAQPFFDLVTLRRPRDDLEALGIVTDDLHNNRHRGDIRRLLFIQLLRDPDYRRHFVRFVTDALNHELTPAFFADLLARYTVLEQAPGVYSQVDLGEYFARRPDYVRGEMAERFGLGAPLTVSIEAPADFEMVIDGYGEVGAYEGRYFRGQTMTVALAEGNEARLSHWEVDGEREDDRELRLEVTGDSVVRAVLF